MSRIEVTKNKKRVYLPVCHACSNQIKEPEYLTSYFIMPDGETEIKNIFHDRFECFKHRVKTKLEKQFEDDLYNIAKQFHMLYKLNNSTYKQVRARR